jgi:hypothetical protein
MPKSCEIIANGKHHFFKSAFKRLIVNKLKPEKQYERSQNTAATHAKVSLAANLFISLYLAPQNPHHGTPFLFAPIFCPIF